MSASIMRDQLPLRRDIRLVFAFSLAIALLLAVSAIAGIMFQDDLYPAEAVRPFSVPTDIVTLAAALPLLLGSMWLTRRGKLAGLLCWPGVLLYVLYINLVYVVGVPFGPAFPLYLVLVSLSAYTLIGLVAATDADALQRRLAGSAPARTAGAILTVLSVLFIAIQVPQIIAAIVDRQVMAGLDLAPFVGDVIVLLPTWLAGGILLCQRRPLGYVGGAGLLLLGTMLFAGLEFVMLFPALSGSSEVDWIGVAMMLAMGLLCFVPFVLFVRGAD